MARLEVEEVTVRFGGVVAVDGVSLALEPGRVTGLIGPNGAGKTTTFNVITGLQAPTSGRVLLDGAEITGHSVHRRAQSGIGRTFQRLEVFGSLSVRENVLVAAEIHKGWRRDAVDPGKVTRAILERLGLTPFADQPADAVPTGVARLTELGRALAIDPRVLLLDEPTSGLNEQESHALGEVLRELAAEEGRGVLLVEHHVELVMEICSWIHVFDFGRLIAAGPPAEVRADPAVQKAYLGAETPGETLEVGT